MSSCKDTAKDENNQLHKAENEKAVVTVEYSPYMN